MATMVTSTKQLPRRKSGSGPKLPGPNGRSGKGNGHEGPFPSYDSTANRYRVGMWVGLASILMLFTALTSAYIVRAASSNDWKALPMPRILLLSTAVILLSSATLEFAKRKLKASLEGGYRDLALSHHGPRSRISDFAIISLAAIGGAGRLCSISSPQLVLLSLNSNSRRALVGRFAGSDLFIVRTSRPLDERFQAKRLAAAGAVGIYWHFMDVLWIYLFLLLFFWR